MARFGVFLGGKVGCRKPDYLAVLAIGQFRPFKHREEETKKKTGQSRGGVTLESGSGRGKCHRGQEFEVVLTNTPFVASTKSPSIEMPLFTHYALQPNQNEFPKRAQNGRFEGHLNRVPDSHDRFGPFGAFCKKSWVSETRLFGCFGDWAVSAV